ncbi:unnamed protein product [Adineta steineri]|uniref:Uncharacterized protein n=1 Tax=Adineta steineri TaxID=433720 RepID=A0A814DP93_9BILA|nr:unnamed protein product [Adineta steineri]CAF3903778.1 unnamed protein product [Adineta steineri]
MGSIKNNIIHDHIYLSNSEKEKSCNNLSDTPRRKIRKKCDIETEEDREEYFRRRTLNNASCRVSRIHRRTKLDIMITKCVEYEDLNGKLKLKNLILSQVIDQLKDHLRTLVSNENKPN